jgi:hypothetical protein
LLQEEIAVSLVLSKTASFVKGMGRTTGQISAVDGHHKRGISFWDETSD